MPNGPDVLVFDTGPLSHIAKQGWLGALRFITNGSRAVIPDTVVAELRAGLNNRPYLGMVLSAPWLTQHNLTSPAEVATFATFASFLVAGNRNWGEAGVLAYASVHNATAIIDDGPAHKAAKSTASRAGERLAWSVMRSTMVTSLLRWHRHSQMICSKASTGCHSNEATSCPGRRIKD
jgi:hypothetical protein